MDIIINGEKKVFEKGLNVTELLKLCEVEQPDMVSVQLGGEFLRSERYEETRLGDGDEVNFLYFMGGGVSA